MSRHRKRAASVHVQERSRDYRCNLWRGHVHRPTTTGVSGGITGSGIASPAEVDALLCDLADAVLGVCVWLVAEHLHPLPSHTLLTAVFTDHVKLTNLILKERD